MWLPCLALVRARQVDLVMHDAKNDVRHSGSGGETGFCETLQFSTHLARPRSTVL